MNIEQKLTCKKSFYNQLKTGKQYQIDDILEDYNVIGIIDEYKEAQLFSIDNSGEFSCVWNYFYKPGEKKKVHKPNPHKK